MNPEVDNFKKELQEICPELDDVVCIVKVCDQLFDRKEPGDQKILDECYDFPIVTIFNSSADKYPDKWIPYKIVVNKLLLTEVWTNHWSIFKHPYYNLLVELRTK